jgi:hypothetical protein
LPSYFAFSINGNARKADNQIFQTLSMADYKKNYWLVFDNDKNAIL